MVDLRESVIAKGIKVKKMIVRRGGIIEGIRENDAKKEVRLMMRERREMIMEG